MFKRIQYNSPVILTFTFLAFISYLLGKVTYDVSTRYLFTNYKTSLTDPMQYVRLFSYIFGHANWSHFSNNFLIVLLVGPMVEEKYGSTNLIEMIAFTALITGVINTLFFSTALLGASGIVFMLIILSSFANVKSGKIPLTLILVAIFFVGREVLNAMFATDNISHSAHIIGGLCGGILGYLKTRRENFTGRCNLQ
ncbi:rhomboid family intramembrane serine protease [Clostridium sp. PL3]|uniref:Rhomboid family intramembrane serine protease n=1 Tax=Clostridium thailandense TaxID=2794346 RepID=A0A949TU29_9CLOT|nr:rhomboid family intramembrane serine protease [Clostridium thailandense]MBV7276497.1 rhomboid family intramembrane serine protease [Clostridium thailandense]